MSLNTSESQLKSLSATAGVDLLALRDKYSSTRYRNTSSIPDEARDATVDISEEERVAMVAAHGRLDDYKICQTCQGQGFIKETYNFQVRDKNCPDCDGESIIMKSHVAAEEAKLLAELRVPVERDQADITLQK
jgi:DnaJ-class molecular chaperone